MRFIAPLLFAIALNIGCTPGPRYIKGDPLHEQIRAQKYPKCPPASYPQYAAMAHEQGVTKLLVLVSVDGSVLEATLDQSSGYSRLDDETLRHVRRCQFEPRTEEGKPVPYRTRFSFHWELWA